MIGVRCNLIYIQMENCIHGEKLKKHQRLNVGLAKEIDYKNRRLFEMENKMGKKDILLKEALEERLSFKLELEKLKNEMEYKKKELELRGIDFNDLQALVVTQDIKQENDNTRSVGESQKMKYEQPVNGLDECDYEGNLKLNDAMGNKDELMKLKEKLKDLENEKADMKDVIQALILKERITNDESIEARKEAIRLWERLSTHHRTKIRIKVLGQVDRKPFQAMCSKNCSGGEQEEESAKLCSLWEEKVQNPHWHPFKRVEENGKLKEIIDEDDEKLKQLRDEGGEHVYKAVADALMELNEYNPSGRYPISELWNFTEERKASLKEIIQYIIKQLTHLKGKNKCCCR